MNQVRPVQRGEKFGLDATRITSRIYQGSKPPKGPAVSASGFHVLVLAAEEYQPPSIAFPGLELVVHAGIDDNRVGPTIRELETVHHAAKVVARSVELGKRVLITCQMGLNRSGIITALAIRRLMKNARGIDVVTHIQRKRDGALNNPWFVKHILKTAP